jgi:putative SOS response-associated peptidase YedK
MCNLYSETSNVDAIRALFKDLDVSAAGNMPTYPAVFPDYAAPIIRNRDGGRELVTARWGMPTPPNYLAGKRTDPGVTNKPASVTTANRTSTICFITHL